MALNSAFTPQTQTLPLSVTTGVSAVFNLPLVQGQAVGAPPNYRIKFTAAAAGTVYFNWAAAGAVAPTIAVPSSGTPYSGMSLDAGQIDFAALPPGAQIIAIGTVAGTLEFTGGEGM